MKQTPNDIFRGVSDFLWRDTDSSGRLICRKHRVEHTGKNAYSVITDLHLFAQTGEDLFFDRARRRALRVAGNMLVHPRTGHYYYGPGRQTHTNMSNAVIDSGGATDALSEMILRQETGLTPGERESIRTAILRNAETYLARVVPTKELPDQRLWGGAALASAYRIFQRPEWRSAMIRGIERTISQQWPDGAFPYHPNWREYRLAEAMHDTTAFYHSRQIGFTLHMLECMNESVAPYKDALLRAGEFLLAMSLPGGHKLMTLETKRWYWFSSYEVAASGFDIYTLVRLAELSGDARYTEAAARAWQALLHEVCADGGIDAHHEHLSSFQCRIFWNAHLAWLTRVADRIPQQVPDAPVSSGLRHFSSADVVRLDTPRVTVVLRGRKQPMDTLYGPPLGGGSVVGLAYPDQGGKNLIVVPEWTNRVPGNILFARRGWSARRLMAFVKRERRNLRSLAFYWYVEIRGLNWRGVWDRGADLLWKLWSAGKNEANTGWATHVETTVVEGGVRYVFSPETREGLVWSAVQVTRQYDMVGQSVQQKDAIIIRDPAVRWVRVDILGRIVERGRGVGEWTFTEKWGA